MLRVLLLGKACTKTQQDDGAIKHTSMSNFQVCQYLNLPPLHILVSTNRLKFFQSMIRSPGKHDLYLSTLFNPYIFESRQVATNPFLEQIYMDMCMLSGFDHMMDVCETLQSKYEEKQAQCLRLMITDTDMHDTFCSYDLTELKIASLKTTGYPAIWQNSDKQTRMAVKSGKDEEQDGSNVYKCFVKTIHGQPCTSCFKTPKALSMHLRTSKQHDSTQYISIPSIVKVNQCCFCESVLKSKQVAVNHVRNSLMSGHCRTDDAFFDVPLQTCPEITCPFCRVEFQICQSIMYICIAISLCQK